MKSFRQYIDEAYNNQRFEKHKKYMQKNLKNSEFRAGYEQGQKDFHAWRKRDKSTYTPASMSRALAPIRREYGNSKKWEAGHKEGASDASWEKTAKNWLEESTFPGEDKAKWPGNKKQKNVEVNYNEVVIKTFDNDRKADDFYKKYNTPDSYKGKKVLGSELQYKDKTTKKTQIVLQVKK